MIIELTEAQAEVLLQLIDLANKAGGLPVSRNCIFFEDKIKHAAYNVGTPIETPKPTIEPLIKRGRGRPRNAA